MIDDYQYHSDYDYYTGPRHDRDFNTRERTLTVTVEVEVPFTVADLQEFHSLAEVKAKLLPGDTSTAIYRYHRCEYVDGAGTRQ